MYDAIDKKIIFQIAYEIFFTSKKLRKKYIDNKKNTKPRLILLGQIDNERKLGEKEINTENNIIK